MKGKERQEIPDLVSARKLIIAHAGVTESERVAVEEALYRVPAESLRAITPQPGYDQSTRDGFVVSGKSALRSGNRCTYHIEGEIRAGSTEKRTLQQGLAWRIMTGGLVPVRGIRVIPQEDCEARGAIVSIPDEVLHRRETFIRRKGSELGRGQVVVPAGIPILPDHLVLLAATGYSSLLVHRRPRVAFFCTGSELVASPAEEEEGLKVSGNRYLLNGLIRLSGGLVEDLGRAADTTEDLSTVLDRIDREATDVIITTGGMGPGKYDLLEKAFSAAGGNIIYQTVRVRPGKATLFGLLGNTLFFGLPGPPPAVRVLFNELVAPALKHLMGIKKYGPMTGRAFLRDPVFLKEKGVASLKGGILLNGASVRLAGKREAPGCYILFPGHRRTFKKGERVEVHLADPYPWGGFHLF